MVDVVCVCLFCLLSLNSMSIIVFIRVLMFFGLLLLIVFHNCFLILGLYGVSEFINLKPEYVKTYKPDSTAAEPDSITFGMFPSIAKPSAKRTQIRTLSHSSLVGQPNRKSILGRSCSQAGKRPFAFFYFSRSKTVFMPVRAQRPRISCTVNSHCILWNLAV